MRREQPYQNPERQERAAGQERQHAARESEQRFMERHPAALFTELARLLS